MLLGGNRKSSTRRGVAAIVWWRLTDKVAEQNGDCSEEKIILKTDA
jgi:hypothetical protein